MKGSEDEAAVYKMEEKTNKIKRLIVYLSPIQLKTLKHGSCQKYGIKTACYCFSLFPFSIFLGRGDDGL